MALGARSDWREYFPPSQSANYNDPRWQRRRLEVLQAADFRCGRCKRQTDDELHVHHVNYRPGVALWEYPDADLLCLCHRCHDLITGRIRRARRAISTDDLCGLLTVLSEMEDDLGA